MNEKALKLLARMIITTMAGDKRRTSELHKRFCRESRLYITIGEYINWRRENERAI